MPVLQSVPLLVQARIQSYDFIGISPIVFCLCFLDCELVAQSRALFSVFSRQCSRDDNMLWEFSIVGRGIVVHSMSHCIMASLEGVAAE